MSSQPSVDHGPFVDLRSDTLTVPTPAMREAMAAAPVGDDVYAEDPTAEALQEELATRFGHEAGLFFPSGTMANQVGLRLLVDPGHELLCDGLAHVVRAEMGAAAALGGVTTRTWASRRGRLVAADALAMATPDAGPYLVSTAAIAVEDTHNFGGGTVQDVDQHRALRAGATAMGIATHLDGARVWNAHLATGVPLDEYGACYDTVSVCLSKGLGAPVGSVLLASADRIARARVLRKRYGGGMRQIGMLAAAAQHALHHHLPLLAHDHARAARIAAAVAAIRPDVCDPADVRSNIVMFDLTDGPDAATVAERAAAQGVRISVLGPRVARVVTHLDLDDAAVDRACGVLADVLT